MLNKNAALEKRPAGQGASRSPQVRSSAIECRIQLRAVATSVASLGNKGSLQSPSLAIERLLGITNPQGNDMRRTLQTTLPMPSNTIDIAVPILSALLATLSGCSLLSMRGVDPKWDRTYDPECSEDYSRRRALPGVHWSHRRTSTPRSSPRRRSDDITNGINGNCPRRNNLCGKRSPRTGQIQ